MGDFVLVIEEQKVVNFVLEKIKKGFSIDDIRSSCIERFKADVVETDREKMKIYIAMGHNKYSTLN